MSKLRTILLREWMRERSITFRAIGEKLGVTTEGARYMLSQDTIPPVRHEVLVALGIPPNLLPTPSQGVLGRPRLEARFPAAHA